MRIPVQMFLDDEGRYVRLIACSHQGVEFDVLRIERRLLNGDFAALVIDADDGLHKPALEPELSTKK